MTLPEDPGINIGMRLHILTDTKESCMHAMMGQLIQYKGGDHGIRTIVKGQVDDRTRLRDLPDTARETSPKPPGGAYQIEHIQRYR